MWNPEAKMQSIPFKQAKLVATKLQSGKKLFETCGQSQDKDKLISFARKCGDCPENIEAVTAESVGLEWHIDGEKKDWSEKHRKDKWVILINK